MNRKTFTVVIVVLVCVVALGFNRGWFKLSSRNPDAGSNKVDVKLTMDKGKMKEDAEAVKKGAADLVGKVKEQTKEAVKPSE